MIFMTCKSYILIERWPFLDFMSAFFVFAMKMYAFID